MKKTKWNRWVALLGLVVAGVLPMVVPSTVGAQAGTVPFKKALLRVEINSTDGDAGLQVDLDHEPWKSISITDPNGRKVLDVAVGEAFASYGLTELFSESSEPPFEQFPLEEFKKLFPAGDYAFRGETIDGRTMASTVRLTHDFPDGPRIREPKEDFTYNRDDLEVKWSAVTTPRGIKIVKYQVLVISEKSGRVFSADLAANARSIEIPTVFLKSGAHKVEVLAIEQSGNQTLSELAFNIR